MNEPTVSVALCTCNGERFLGDQLDSLSRQSHLPSELIACDDRSADSTLPILEGYARSAPFSVRVIRNSERLGVASNFGKALAACSGEYIALCDQDDVWKPDKLERLAAKAIELKQSGNKGPYFIHSDLELVDAELNTLGSSYLEHQGLKLPQSRQYRTLLVQNYIPGCSTLFSRELLDVALPIPGEAVMHDWWLALIASITGSLACDPARTVLYRQHGGNQLGSQPRFSGRTARQILTVKPALDVIRHNFSSGARQAIAVDARLRACNIEVPGEVSAYVNALAKSRLKILGSLLSGRIGRSNQLRNLALLLAVLLLDMESLNLRQPDPQH